MRERKSDAKPEGHRARISTAIRLVVAGGCGCRAAAGPTSEGRREEIGDASHRTPTPLLLPFSRDGGGSRSKDPRPNSRRKARAKPSRGCPAAAETLRARPLPLSGAPGCRGRRSSPVSPRPEAEIHCWSPLSARPETLLRRWTTFPGCAEWLLRRWSPVSARPECPRQRWVWRSARPETSFQRWITVSARA